MRFYAYVTTTAVFLSAYLLFVVQPMVGKYLLPLLGGGPSVWNTAMLFFQILLLGGYAYAHGMARFVPVRSQYIVHLSLFVLAALSLPLALTPGAEPTGQDPMMWQLRTMLGMAAGPFFILSATAPLLQQWFSKTAHERAENPYFLYAASNIGSMLALLSYPFLVEPALNLSSQSFGWSWGYGLLGVLILLSALLSKPATKVEEKIESVEEDVPITWRKRGAWLLLSFIPSSLMLGFTSYITSDVTTVPLFWIIPLSLYLLTFIIAFSEKSFFSLPLTRIIQGASVLLLLFHMMFNGQLVRWEFAGVHVLFFFFTALLCHQELVAQKPKPRHLTEFFLIMSLGGALGGLFNSIIAPLIFSLPYEYMATALLSTFFRFSSSQPLGFLRFERKDFLKKYAKFAGVIALVIAILLVDMPLATSVFGAGIIVLCSYYMNSRLTFGVLCALLFLVFPIRQWTLSGQDLVTSRNYYGVIRVRDEGGVRTLLHGVTNHGGQSLDPKDPFKPFGYYDSHSGLADVFALPYINAANQTRKIAVIGLGTGAIACFFNREDRRFNYYEIDPAVVEVAQDPKYFTYLSDCVSHSTVQTGDGRLLIAHAPDHSYDVIALDAFTSDNIPLHIITKEAMQLYLQKLKPDGILVFHVTNRFFDLENELAVTAKALGYKTLFKFNIGDDPRELKEAGKSLQLATQSSKYVVITSNESVQADLLERAQKWKVLTANEDWKPWTDSYANILRSIRQ